MSFNTISVIGLGYIGLPTAAMFASKGKKVVGVDVNQHAVDTINAGNVHIVEPQLSEIVKSVVEKGFLKAVMTPEPADAFLIAVPTPFLAVEEDGANPEPDLSFIKAAALSLAKVLKKGDLVVLESTSPVGVTEQLSEWLATARPDLNFPHQTGESSDIRVAYCPERVLPGQVVRELVENDRIIGGMTVSCSKAAIELYRIFVVGECLTSNAQTAELVKLTENASRDINIAFANELSVICDKLDIDVWELINLANRHPRVNILQPGPGVGGHCIAVDPWFIVSRAPNDSHLIKAARSVNNAKPDWVVEKVRQVLIDILNQDATKAARDISLACLGLTFKADIDDLRESPALEIVEKIVNLGFGEILIVEPNISRISHEADRSISLTSIEQALLKADVLLILVDHEQFRNLDEKVKSSFIGTVIDTRGIWR